MKKPLAQIIPLLARGMAPTAAVATSLLSPVALAASGDLDPTFGDVGRVTLALDFAGTAWSVQPLDNDASIFAGGRESHDYFYSRDFIDEGFEGRLGGAGSLESRFQHIPASTEVRDVALQVTARQLRSVAPSDGRTRNSASLMVFRVQSDGTLDSTFGDAGIVRGFSGRRRTVGDTRS